uniref:Ig-like domain-containing protein n=1 Tax=Poecilia formosa TaxID=48698 RepID=A0A087XMP4_POEFO
IVNVTGLQKNYLDVFFFYVYLAMNHNYHYLLFVSVKSPVSVQRGHTAILPCWLTFSQSAEDMKVHWYQGSDEYDPPILLYKARAFDFSSQKPSFAGRVSFGLKEETSGGLKAGDVSLKLENVTIEDVGKYTCYVSSSDDDDSASISLSVTETGRSPLLSAVMRDHKKVNMSCQSDGWHPKPELSWSDSKTALTPADVMFSKNSAGFYSVHSWVLVSSPFEVSCSVGLFNEEPKETRMRLENPSSLEDGQLKMFSETFTVSIKSPVSVQRGHTAILPCWLTFSESAEDMEVHWYQRSDEYDTPVLLYKERAFDYSSQKASYAGRVSLGLKEETSGGLKAGDVSLKLENVTIEDAGKYICLVSSFDDYDSATISLSVTETGHQPLLSAVMKDDNKVNVSCQSDGWYPKPELSWSDSKTALTPANVSFSKNSAGFYSVHSWVLVSSPSEVSCSVGLFNEEPKET